MDYLKRKVTFFRCHIDPGIGPMPKHAIHIANMKLQAELLPFGIYVKLPSGEEHIVPYANCQTIKLAPEENHSSSSDENEEKETSGKPGNVGKKNK